METTAHRLPGSKDTGNAPGLRPCATTPKYLRACFSGAGIVRAKQESRRSGPGGGNTCVMGRAKSAWIFSRA